MKTILTIAALILLATPPAAAAGTDRIVVHVKGMVCDFCAQAIEKVMAKEPGIDAVKIDLDSATVTFTEDGSIDVTDAFIRDLLTDSGYDVDRIERRPAE